MHIILTKNVKNVIIKLCKAVCLHKFIIGAEEAMEKVDLLKSLTEVCNYSFEEAVAIVEKRIVIKNEDLENVIAAILRDLGVSTRLCGYQYTIEAVKIILEENIVMLEGQVTTHIYPTVAKKYGKKAATVERGVRHAIQSIWKNMNNTDTLKWYFGNVLDSKEAPSVGSFIFAIADYIRRNNSK